METSKTTTGRNYKVSERTARLADCLVASQELYAKVFTIASEIYGEDNEAIQQPLLKVFEATQEEICKIMNGNIIANIGDLHNLANPQVSL